MTITHKMQSNLTLVCGLKVGNKSYSRFNEDVSCKSCLRIIESNLNKVDKKRHKCDFCGLENIATEGFKGTLNHYLYACGACLKHRTDNRTIKDSETNLRS